MDDDDVMSPILERRNLLRMAGAIGAVGLGIAALGRDAAARRGDGDTTNGETTNGGVDDNLPTSQEDALFAAMCTLSPTATEGPYYLNLNLLRGDITEGKPGFPTSLALRVVRAADCSPIPNAVVDVWHADHLGVYSGIAQQGTTGLTYMRGVQVTNAGGIVRFQTIFPGWYPGRTTHIHVKVRPTSTTEVTSQLFFGDALANRIYLLPAYASHGPKNTLNAQDGIYNGASAMLMGVQRNPLGGMTTGLTIGVA